MANVVSDPKQQPEAVIPDFSKPDPLLTFKLTDVAFVYGSKWKQRYFTKVGNDYFPLPAQWDVPNRIWRAYMVQPNTDWWVPFYPADNMKRPTGPLCDGCHSVNYNIKTKTVTEWNVGCEKCHGPGSEHVRQPSAATIVNPARLDFVRANDTCIQCHSQGQPLTNPIDGQYYDWPVGFKVGLELKDFWKLEEHKLGETTFTHFADGTAHKNRMQGNDFVQSVDVHARRHLLQLPRRARHVEQRGPGQAGGRRLCHVPRRRTRRRVRTPRRSRSTRITRPAAPAASASPATCRRSSRTIANVNVRSHTFQFITPTMTEQYKIPNACIGCHTERSQPVGERAAAPVVGALAVAAGVTASRRRTQMQECTLPTCDLRLDCDYDFVRALCPFGRNRVVVPLDDLPVLQEEHADAVPALEREVREAVDALVDDHRTAGERVENLELLDVVDDRLDARGQRVAPLRRLHRFGHAVGAVLGEERQNPVQIVAGPRGAEVLHDLDVGLLER